MRTYTPTPVAGTGQRASDGGDAPPWTMTFADVASLVMCVIVLLLAVSEMRGFELGQLTATARDALEETAGVAGGSDTGDGGLAAARPRRAAAAAPAALAPEIERLLARDVEQGLIDVERSGQRIVIRIRDTASPPVGLGR